MAGPVPPQGAPAPQEGGGIDDVINSIGQGLQMLVDALASSAAPPEVVEPFAAALDAFSAGAQALKGGGQQPQGAAPMEAGAAQAVPAGNMQVRG